MTDTCIITRIGRHMLAFSYEKEQLMGIEVLTKQNEQPVIGDIYTARVKNIVPNIRAAFLDIGGTSVYYALDDNSHTCFLNSKKTKQLVCNDEILIQIDKDAVKTKQPGASCYFTIPGTYCIVTYHKPGIGISRKIKDESVRRRLKQCYRTIFQDEPEFGIIVRTEAATQDTACLLEDAQKALSTAKDILQRARTTPAGKCLYKQSSCYDGILHAISNESSSCIITDDPVVYKEIADVAAKSRPAVSLSFYDRDLPLKTVYDLQVQLDRACSKTVWLPCGGYLVLEPTEALTVIDVNTGKSIMGKQTKKEHILKVNLEAAKAIGQQLAVRNYSGMILIDFIDMESKKQQEILYRQMQTILEHDPVKTTLVDITALGLMEITRKKIKRPLHEQLR